MRIVCLYILLLAGFLSTSPAAWAGNEWIVLSGGPALRHWEKSKQFPHDRVWDNFIFTSRLRINQIRQSLPADDFITWLVYRPGYVTRGREDGVDYIAQIDAYAREMQVNLVWFDHQNHRDNELIDYLNHGQDRQQVKIANFDYFGHSNKRTFMFDYSNEVDGMVVDWLHTTSLNRIKRGAFLPNATCKSYGCHSADSFTVVWQQATGTRMIGTKGKTDYSARSWPVPSKNAKWE